MAVVKNEMLASEPIPISHRRTCINSARTKATASYLSYPIEMFTSVFGGNAESKIWESKRTAFNFKN